MTALSEPTRVAVVNDFEVVVRGVFGILAPFADRVQVLELAVDVPPSREVDVVLYDAFSMEGVRTDAIGELVDNPLVGAVVIYTWADSTDVVEEALSHRVRGVLSKSLDGARLVDALRRVHAGEIVIDPPHPVDDTAVPGDWPGRSEGLTGREAEILALITLGLSNQEIATRTYLSINSVKSYIRSCYRRIEVRTRSQAVRWAIEHGVDREPVRIVLETPTPAPTGAGTPRPDPDPVGPPPAS